MRRSWFLFVFLSVISPSSASTPPLEISQAEYRDSSSPESIPAAKSLVRNISLQLSHGYFSGGGDLLHLVQSPDPHFYFPRSFSFHSTVGRQTQTPCIFDVEGQLLLLGSNLRFFLLSPLAAFRQTQPPTPVHEGALKFDLSGSWSASTGELCMEGCALQHPRDGNPIEFSIVFKIKYPAITDVYSSLVSCSIERLATANSSNYFDPIYLLAYSPVNYHYTLIPEAMKWCSQFHDAGEDKVAFNMPGFHYFLRYLLHSQFKLEYGNHCSSKICGPFAKELGFSPRFMSLNRIHSSEDGRLHMLLGFSNLSNAGHNSPLIPETTLIGEGYWDKERSRLCVVACRILNFSETLEKAYVGDCTIGFSLWFPAVISITNSSPAIGRIWSDRENADPSYFEIVSFRSLDLRPDAVSELKYKFSKMDVVSKRCGRRSSAWNSRKRRYPDGMSIEGMKFDFSLRDAKRRKAWGEATLISIGETISRRSFIQTSVEELNRSLWNVSYKISYRYPESFFDNHEPVEISAEGVYDAQTGWLCMVGCRNLGFPVNRGMDCEIFIDIQVPPLNAEVGEHFSGKISSTREESDPFYFEPLEISWYKLFTEESLGLISRTETERTNVLIPLGLLCMVILLTLLYMKKHHG